MASILWQSDNSQMIFPFRTFLLVKSGLRFKTCLEIRRLASGQHHKEEKKNSVRLDYIKTLSSFNIYFYITGGKSFYANTRHADAFGRGVFLGDDVRRTADGHGRTRTLFLRGGQISNRILIARRAFDFHAARSFQRAAKKNYQRGFAIGLIIGVVLFIATSMQQVALQYSTAGKAAFITCLYIVFVPLGAKLLGKVIRRENLIGVGLAIVGLYLLAVGESFSVQIGDVILFASSFFWTAHILIADRFANKVDVIEMSTAQIFTTLILSSAAMFTLESPTLGAMTNAWFPILYGGLMSSGVAFTLQIYGQKYADPSTAAILMSFEAIFGALAGWFFLNEVMSAREIFGCVLMLAGMFATQWTLIKKSV